MTDDALPSAEEELITVTLAERPDLAGAIPAVLASRWPAYMLGGTPAHGVDLTVLAAQAPAHQLILLDGEDVIGVGLSVPLHWDGTPEGLPAGWDGAVRAGAALLATGAAPTAVCALSITIVPAAAGRGLAPGMIEAFKNAGAAVGARALIGPVRPVRKPRYPLTPLDEYARWRTPDGEVFDPWLRLHLGLGARQLTIADPSMTVTGTVAQWQEWTGLALPATGRYVIPGGLSPLEVDIEADLGVYREANVWVAHPIRSS
jgi:hypothetical protein